MAEDDGAAAHVAVTAMVTAALFSPRARGLLRQGAVHALAGVLIAADAMAAFARGVSEGVENASEKRGEAPTAAVGDGTGPYAPTTASEVTRGASAPDAAPPPAVRARTRRSPRKRAAATPSDAVSASAAARESSAGTNDG